MNKANAVDVLHNLCDPSLTKKVITNEYLLTQILKRVNYFQLPELRLVNRQWNKSILNLFRQITVPEYPPKTFFCKCFSVVDPEKFTKFNSMQYSFSCYFKKILIHTHNLKTLQLSEMNLNSNQLESLFEQPFMGNLERLELGDNVYSNDMNFNLFPSKIEQLLIQYCPNVKHLALPYNFLKSLNNVDSKWTAFCRRLKSIKIDDVDFLEIPQNIEPLNELEVFDVEYSQIPEQIWKTLNYYMPNLQKLYVSDSSFRYMSLKKSFPKFNNLVELYLYDFVDPLNDIIKMVGQRYGTTLKVLGLCEFCLCDGISEDTLNQFTELQFFQHCRKSCKCLFQKIIKNVYN